MKSNHLSIEEYDQLIAAIYRAGSEPEYWPEFCDALDRILDGVWLMLQGHDLQTNCNVGIIPAKFDPEFVESFHGYYAAINPWISGLAGAPVGKPLIPEDVVEREDLFKTEFYADWVLPQENIASGAGAVIFRESDRMLALTGNIRLGDEERFQPKALETIERITPHVQRAFDIQRSLSGQQLVGKGYQRAIDSIPNAIFLLNRHGQPAVYNQAAEQLLRIGDIVRLGPDGRLRSTDPSANNIISANLKQIRLSAFDQFTHLVPMKAQDDGLPFLGKFTPFFGNYDSFDFLSWFSMRDPPIAMLAIIDPLKPVDPDDRVLKHLFGMTPAEIRLVRSLSKGHSIKQHCLLHDLSENTVRNQLKSAFQKTGTGRQGELIALISQLA